MEKDKLIDLLFARNESLENKLDWPERQGLKFEEQMNSLQSQLQRMEERAVAAERRADMEAKARLLAEERSSDLTAALTGMMGGTVIKDFKEQIAKAEKERDDARSSDRQNRAERYGSTSRKI